MFGGLARDRHYPGPTTVTAATTAEVVDATRFLLENGATNGANPAVDGGRLCL